MEFHFLDPGPLVDRELELVAPASKYFDDVLTACNHPESASDRAASNTTRERLHDFLKLAPLGRQRGDANRGIVPSYHFWMRVNPFEGVVLPPVRIAGGIGLRVGNTPDLELYLGHVGYNVY